MREYLKKPTVRTNPRTGEALFVATFAPFPGLMALPMATLAQSLGARLWEDAPTVFLVGKLAAALLIAASAALAYVLSRPACRTMFIDHA